MFYLLSKKHFSVETFKDVRNLSFRINESMSSEAIELPGLIVQLDRLVHQYSPKDFSEEKPHAFIYYLTIENQSDETLTLLGRKWIVEYDNGTTEVIEGDGIVGQTPRIEPSGSFSYNSFHLTKRSGKATGSFHGQTASGQAIFTRIPGFELKVPDEPYQA